MLAQFTIDVSRTRGKVLPVRCSHSASNTGCFAQQFLFRNVERLTLGLLGQCRLDALFPCSFTQQAGERSGCATNGGTRGGSAAEETKTSRGDGLDHVRPLLGEVGYQPLDSAATRLDVSELSLVGGSPAQVFHLLTNDAATSLLSTGKLQGAASQHLRDIDTATEVACGQRTQRRVAHVLHQLAVGLCVQRNPVTFGWQTGRWATKQTLGLQQRLCVVTGERGALDKELFARLAVANGRWLLHLRHREPVLTGQLHTSLTHDGKVGEVVAQRVRPGGSPRIAIPERVYDRRRNSVCVLIKRVFKRESFGCHINVPHLYPHGGPWVVA